jgi:hypothetical protein
MTRSTDTNLDLDLENPLLTKKTATSIDTEETQPLALKIQLLDLEARLNQLFPKQQPAEAAFEPPTHSQPYRKFCSYSSFTLLAIAGLIWDLLISFFGLREMCNYAGLVNSWLVNTAAVVLTLISAWIFYVFEVRELAAIFNIQQEKAPQILQNHLDECAILTRIYRTLDQQLRTPHLPPSPDLIAIIKNATDYQEELIRSSASTCTLLEKRLSHVRYTKRAIATLGAFVFGVYGYILGEGLADSMKFNSDNTRWERQFFCIFSAIMQAIFYWAIERTSIFIYCERVINQTPKDLIKQAKEETLRIGDLAFITWEIYLRKTVISPNSLRHPPSPIQVPQLLEAYFYVAQKNRKGSLKMRALIL